MKPRLFIGSSRENLDVAYSIQLNIKDSAEVTVWTQGIFQPSQSNLESLLSALEGFDFGVFVFSPDDIINIRGEENRSVRDNVLFELGLFVGRLGRKRCFIFAPEAEEFHLPTDLIGMNPTIYEAKRADKNYQAGTAPACHEIRNIIRKEGFTTEEPSKPETPSYTKDRKESSASPENIEAKISDSPEQSIDEDSSWLDAWIKGNPEKSLQLLEGALANAHDEKEILRLESWKIVIVSETDFGQGVQLAAKLNDKYPNIADSFSFLATLYQGAGFYDEAITAIDNGLEKFPRDPNLIARKADILSDMGETQKAAEILLAGINNDPIENHYSSLADIMSNAGKETAAGAVIEFGLSKFPLSEPLLSKYAKVLTNLQEHPRAAVVYRKLIRLKPDSETYLTLAGNAYVSLKFPGLALDAYLAANKLASEKQSWIIGNIGNVYNNQNFYSIAIDYLNNALTLDPSSQYAQERLLSAKRSLAQETKKLDQLLQESSKLPKLTERFVRRDTLEELVLKEFGLDEQTWS